MITPFDKYQELINSGELEEDAQQKEIVVLLNDIYLELLPRFKTTNFLTRLFSGKPEPVKGLYLWGGVGVGKTRMMDIFYNALPDKGKLRMHFHQFMLSIHKKLQQHKDEQDPLILVARQIAKDNIIICFDEFFVSHIADAMLLAGLFDALFKEGVSLITTSNVKPDDLYKGGISRDRFLPTIELLKKYTHVIHIQSKKDYRLRELKSAGTYLMPLGEDTRKKMRKIFESLTDKAWTENELIIIAGRGIQTLRKGSGIIWFVFENLCSVPRSQVDYIEIAESYHTVILSNIPKLTDEQTNEALYLINLVDVFYDANVKLLVSAACPIDEIYEKGEMQFEFERTKSRLREMQALEYLQKPHRY
jgi:cell division protein ZapE